MPRGTVKKLRLYAFEYGYIDSPTEHYAQGIQVGWDMKRLLGTVPVEKDGSAIFKVPANMPISIQPLDSLDRAVQWMRSWITSMPGETVSCIACHNNDHKIYFTSGEMVEAPTDWTGFKKYFGRSYLEFHKFFYRQGPEADMYVLEPYEYHVSNSEMIRMLKKGHYSVELTDKEWLSVNRWLDMNGNVEEWTRSDYRNYPLNKNSKMIANEKVARGGSWTDRPKHSTSTYRKSFLPWQNVYNV